MKNITEHIRNIFQEDQEADQIFSQMKEFLDTHVVVDKDDIVRFFSVLFDFSDQIQNMYFSSVSVSDENGYYEVIDFLLHDFYDYQEDHFEWQIDHSFVLKDKSFDAHDLYVSIDVFQWTLHESFVQWYEGPIVSWFQQIIKKVSNKILWMLERKEIAAAFQQQQKKQKILEQKQARIVKALSSVDEQIVPLSFLATEEDFADWYYSVQNIIHEVYAEKAEYFNNLFLWFDLQKWRFATAREKRKQYDKYFYEKWKQQIRLQEIPKIHEGNTLPVFISQASLQLLDVIQNNTRSLLETDEQKIDYWFSVSRYAWSSQEEKDALKKIILQRFVKNALTSDEEKKKMFFEIMGKCWDIERRKKWRLDIDLPLSSDAKMYISQHIWKCNTAPRFSPYHITNHADLVEQMPEKWQQYLVNQYKEIDLKEKKLWEEIFWEDFDFDVLRNDPWFQRDLKFYSRACHMELDFAYRMTLSGKYPWNQRIWEFLEKRNQFFSEKEMCKKETLKSYALLHDVDAIETLEQTIQEKFDKHFAFDGEVMKAILSSMLKQMFHTRIHDGVDDTKELKDITKRFILFSRLRHIDIEHITSAYEKAFETLPDYHRLKIFLATVREIWLHPSYNKDFMKSILQKEYDFLQYGCSSFWLHHINSLEEIKKIALEFSVELDLPKHSPLEEYYICRLRTPERILKAQSRKNSFDRHSGTIGYEDDDLASVINLEKFAQELWVPLKRMDVLNMDMRVYKDIPESQWFDLDVVVPVAVKFPKVRVVLHGNRNNEGKMQWHYIFLYDETIQQYRLIFDDSFIDARTMMQKYTLFDHVVLWWWFLVFDKITASMQVEDRIDDYHHEPRILTVTALKNAVKHVLPDWKLFIGKDALDKMSDYF